MLLNGLRKYASGKPTNNQTQFRHEYQQRFGNDSLNRISQKPGQTLPPTLSPPTTQTKQTPLGLIKSSPLLGSVANTAVNNSKQVTDSIMRTAIWDPNMSVGRNLTGHGVNAGLGLLTGGIGTVGRTMYNGSKAAIKSIKPVLGVGRYTDNLKAQQIMQNAIRQRGIKGNIVLERQVQNSHGAANLLPDSIKLPKPDLESLSKHLEKAKGFAIPGSTYTSFRGPAQIPSFAIVGAKSGHGIVGHEGQHLINHSYLDKIKYPFFKDPINRPSLLSTYNWLHTPSKIGLGTNADLIGNAGSAATTIAAYTGLAPEEFGLYSSALPLATNTPLLADEGLSSILGAKKLRRGGLSLTGKDKLSLLKGWLTYTKAPLQNSAGWAGLNLPLLINKYFNQNPQQLPAAQSQQPNSGVK